MALRRALLPSALAAVLLTSGSLLPDGGSPAQATTAGGATPMVANASFEQGTEHWNTGRTPLRLTTTADSWHGARALRAASAKRTKVRVRHDHRIKPQVSGKVRWTVRVKPARTRPLTLAIVERTAAGKRKVHRTKVTAPARAWTKIRVTVKKRNATSSFRPVVRGPARKHGATVKVDDLRVRHLAPPRTEGKLSNGCSYTARGLPDCGSYLGMAYGSNSDPSGLEEEIGAQLGVRRTFFRADQVASAVRTAKTDLQAGRLPWISFKFPHRWEAMESGQGDAWAKSLARQFAALDGPVWLAFHHEPENDGDIQVWRRVQERLAPIVRGAGDNIAFTVVLTGWHQFYGASEFSLARIWPRGVKVDVAGFDIYNSHGVVKNGKTLKPTDMDGAYFAKIQSWADDQGVAWGLAETGFNDTAHDEDPNWVRRTHRQLTKRDGVAMAYFNTTLNSITSWRLGTGAKWRGFRDAAVEAPRLPRP